MMKILSFLVCPAVVGLAVLASVFALDVAREEMGLE